MGDDPEVAREVFVPIGSGVLAGSRFDRYVCSDALVFFEVRAFGGPAGSDP
jgi:hypothetical protein